MLALALNTHDAVSLFDNRLGLDVVLVADLADDLLDQILEADKTCGAAVLVDDDGQLYLLSLKLLQELRHALGLRHEGRRPHQAGNRLVVGIGFAEQHQVLDEDNALNVVDVFFEHRNARVLLLAEERAQFADGRLGRNRDDVGPRRHDFANERTAEVDDRLQERRSSRSIRFGSSLSSTPLAASPSRSSATLPFAATLALTPAVDNQAHQRPGERVEEAGGEIERRQQDLERLLRVLAGR